MLKVRDLSKKYGKVQAVQGLSFELGSGEFVGFVGGNGAGKSTTIKMLTGQLLPSSGQIEIAGLSIDKDPNLCRSKVGYVPEFPELYEYLTGREMLEFVIAVRKSGDLAVGLDIAGLGNDIDRMIREYSQGMRRKIALACAMVAKPPLLVLDESMNGLDPSSVKRIQGVLEEFRQEGCSILLSTHILDSLERMATRLLVIEKGRLIDDCDVSEMDRIRDRF